MYQKVRSGFKKSSFLFIYFYFLIPIADISNLKTFNCIHSSLKFNNFPYKHESFVVAYEHCKIQTGVKIILLKTSK